jgi:hypothetical protein
VNITPVIKQQGKAAYSFRISEKIYNKIYHAAVAAVAVTPLLQRATTYLRERHRSAVPLAGMDREKARDDARATHTVCLHREREKEGCEII